MEPISLELENLDFLRELARENSIPYFNCRFLQSEITSLSLLNHESRSSNTGIIHGFSVQAFIDGGWGMAAGNDFTRDNIEQVFFQSIKLAKWSAQYAKEQYSLLSPPSITENFIAPLEISLNSIGPDEKIRNLLALDQIARDFDPRIVSTEANYSDSDTEHIIFNSAGGFIRTKISQIHTSIQCVAKDGANLQGYHVSHANCGGYEIFNQADHIATEAAENSIELLDSKPVKPGMFDIIMDPKLAGTFIHEAFGHASEADAIIAGESILVNKLNEQVGTEIVNVIDDASMEGTYGWTPFDDEGSSGHNTPIVTNGILTNYLHSLETASKLNGEPTGNARASGYGVPPIVRMTNTYIQAGDWDLDEMIQDMHEGLLCVGWKYGYCEPSNGEFQFKTAKAYLIENGEKTHLYRDAAISGSTLDVLQRIDALSNKVELDPGFCGKSGQSASVTSGDRRPVSAKW